MGFEALYFSVLPNRLLNVCHQFKSAFHFTLKQKGRQKLIPSSKNGFQVAKIKKSFNYNHLTSVSNRKVINSTMLFFILGL